MRNEIARLQEDVNVKKEYQEVGWLEKPHVRAARAINVSSSIVQYFGDSHMDLTKYFNVTEQEKEAMKQKKFNITSKESW